MAVTRVWLIPGDIDFIVDNGTGVPVGIGPDGAHDAIDVTPARRGTP